MCAGCVQDICTYPARPITLILLEFLKSVQDV